MIVGVLQSRYLAHTASEGEVSQQVDPAVVQEVGCALGRRLHHLVLTDHLHRLVVDA